MKLLRVVMMAPSPPTGGPGWVMGVGQVAQVVAASAVLAIAGMVFQMRDTLTAVNTELRNCAQMVMDHNKRITELEKGQAELRAVMEQSRGK